MKKHICRVLLIMTLLVLFALSASAITIPPGFDIGDAISTDIRAYINGSYINSYNINKKTAVLVEDLNYYGYKATWYDKERTLVINRIPGSSCYPNAYDPGPGRAIGQKMYDIFSSDITVYYGTRQLPSFSVGDYTAIYLEDLALNGGSTDWNAQTRKISLYSSPSVYNPNFTITMLGTGYLPSDNGCKPIITGCFYDLNTSKVVTYDYYFPSTHSAQFVPYRAIQNKQYLVLGYVLKKDEYPNQPNNFYRTELELVTSKENIDRLTSNLSQIVKAKSEKVLEQAWLFSQKEDYDSAFALCDSFLNEYSYSSFESECFQVKNYKNDLTVKKVIGEKNEVLRQAKVAYQAGDYNLAIQLCIDFGDAYCLVDRLKDMANEAYAYAYEVADIWRAKSGPLAVVGFCIDPENETTYAGAYFQFRNVSYKTIVSYEFSFDCYDIYGNPVKSVTSTHRTYARSDEEYIISLDPTEGYWVLSGLDYPYFIKNVRVSKVVFSDGEVWGS